MENRVVLYSKNGFSLEKVTHRDENGHVIETSYEVVGPSGSIIASFSSLDEATLHFQNLVDTAILNADDIISNVKSRGWGSPGM
ncbi:TPA: hypothetical protein ACSP2S_000697 [Aeromonas veronii]